VKVTTRCCCQIETGHQWIRENRLDYSQNHTAVSADVICAAEYSALIEERDLRLKAASRQLTWERATLPFLAVNFLSTYFWVRASREADRRVREPSVSKKSARLDLGQVTDLRRTEVAVRQPGAAVLPVRDYFC